MKKRLTLYADDGKVLTDGETYGRIIDLAIGKSEDDYYEISEAEYEKIEQAVEEEKRRHDEAN